MTFTSSIQEDPHNPGGMVLANIVEPYYNTQVMATKPTLLDQIRSDPEYTTQSPKPVQQGPVILNAGEVKTAIKFDTNKADWSMMPWDSVEEILKVLEFGKQKYSAWNWSQGEGFKYSRVFNSLLRHLFAWFRGEDNDPESGLSHLAHAGCNVLFLIYFVKHKNKYKNNDDRV